MAMPPIEAPVSAHCLDPLPNRNVTNSRPGRQCRNAPARVVRHFGPGQEPSRPLGASELADYASLIRHTSYSEKVSMPNTVRLHRVLATKPDKVYRAFIEADAMAKWLPPNGFACTVHHLDAKVGGSFRMSFRNFTTGKSHSFGGQYLTRARRAPALHGQIRRSQSAGRNPGDGGAQASVLRHRAEYRAGRSSRRHSGGSVLSRPAGFVAKSRESRRARNQSIDIGRLIRLAPRRRSRPSSVGNPRSCAPRNR